MCFICQKHAGNVAQPPGGYFYQDDHWRVCHAPASGSALGTLIVESKRHFMDFADMSAPEAASYGPLLSRLYAALRQATRAERIYCLVMLEGAPHFHAWLVPRGSDVAERGLAFLGVDQSCSEADVMNLVTRLRDLLSTRA